MSHSTRTRKGKIETYIHKGWNDLLEAIEQKGEAVPGDLARDLGWPRSTLAHHLAKLQARKLILRMGGGRSIRYRLMTPEERETPLREPSPSPATNLSPGLSPLASAYVKASADGLAKGEAVAQGKGPSEPGPIDKPKKEGILPAGLKNLFWKVLKG
jgi:DNA-binding transcriptional ArsR family regulator